MREHQHRTASADMKATIDRPPDLVRVREVIEVEFRRGEGCCAEDPMRTARAYYALDGTLLAVMDPSRPGPEWRGVTDGNVPTSGGQR